MQEIYILKIGGSVATYKSMSTLRLRKKLLTEIAHKLTDWKKHHPTIQLILIHGAGGKGHHIAQKYNLQHGTKAHKDGARGAILSRLANQQLNTRIFTILTQAWLLTTPIHTASAITQHDGKIKDLHKDIVSHALAQSYIPLFYGEMVFDDNLDMSVCSGNTIAAHLTKHFPVTKMFFATDVCGVYTKDPHRHKNAQLIKDISFSTFAKQNITLTGSHNTDVTNGLHGKIMSFKTLFTGTHLKELHILDGMDATAISHALNGKPFPHTTITK